MAYFSRRTEREKLEKEIQRTEYDGLLAELRRNCPPAEAFTTWTGVFDFLHTDEQDLTKDEILRNIFTLHKHGQDSRWRSILLVIFWPALESIHWKKRHWDTDPEERWQNITWVFLRVVCRIDPVVRPHRLAQKVVNDTIHHLCDDYRHIWRRMEKEIPMNDDELEELGIGTQDIGFGAAESAIEKDRQVECLRRHLQHGRINDSDMFLVIGTRIYGKALSECAAKQGISYQAAKKRRQRAEAIIRKAEEGSEKRI
jgi:hypothetical protein